MATSQFRRRREMRRPTADEMIVGPSSESFQACAREDDVRSRIEALNAEIAKVNRSSIAGPPTTVPVIDVAALVDEWRRRRASE